MPPSRSPVRRPGPLRRLGVLTALLGLLSALMAVTGAATAQADTFPDCREHPNTGNGYVKSADGRWLYIFWILYTEPAFFKGNGQVVENETDSTAGRVASFGVNTTLSISTTNTNATATTLAEGINKTRTTSTNVTASISINETVTDTFTVPARTAFQADYGVYGHRVLMNLDTWKLEDGRCWYYPQYSPRQTWFDAPSDKGWRLQTYPRINVDGIVNGANYRADDLHPGTVAAVFGTNFLPPDKIIVRQFPNQWTIQQGSEWWYDSSRQINVTLPTNLQPGSATMTVLSNNGLESLSQRTFLVNP